MPRKQWCKACKRKWAGRLKGLCKSCLYRERKYGVDASDLANLYRNQMGRCAICGAFPGKRDLNTDHNHTTQEVRGFLCTRCNTGIDHFNEETIQRAADYMKQTPPTLTRIEPCPTNWVKVETTVLQELLANPLFPTFTDKVKELASRYNITPEAARSKLRRAPAAENAAWYTRY